MGQQDLEIWRGSPFHGGYLWLDFKHKLEETTEIDVLFIFLPLL